MTLKNNDKSISDLYRIYVLIFNITLLVLGIIKKKP